MDLLGEDGVGSLRCAWRACFFRVEPFRDGRSTSEALSESLLASSVVSDIRDFFLVISTSGVDFDVDFAGRGVDAPLARAVAIGFAAFTTPTASLSLSSPSVLETALRWGRAFFAGRTSSSESDSLALVVLAGARGGEEGSGELLFRACVLAHNWSAVTPSSLSSSSSLISSGISRVTFVPVETGFDFGGESARLMTDGSRGAFGVGFDEAS